MKKIALWISVRVDDWTTELAIIAGNVPDEKQRWMDGSFVSCKLNWLSVINSRYFQCYT